MSEQQPQQEEDDFAAKKALLRQTLEELGYEEQQIAEILEHLIQ